MNTVADVSVNDLCSIHEAACELNQSWWKTRRDINKGHLEAVKLPNGHRAVIRASVERLLKEREGK
jgi:hypothetical protein